jgi:hypothetical protein
MVTRNRDLETGCQLSLVALIVVACFVAIPPIFNGVVDALVQARVEAMPMRFACRSCGQVEEVRQVTLGAAKHTGSTVVGDSYAIAISLLTGKLGSEPVRVQEVEVRLQDGSVRVFHERLSSTWNPGDRVKVSMGRIKPLS